MTKRYYTRMLAYVSLFILLAGCAKQKGPIAAISVDFNITGNNANAPATVVFTNTSRFANGFVWYFGDGDSAVSVHASHTYNNAGTYDVILKAYTDEGVKQVKKTVTVNTRLYPSAQFAWQMSKPFVNAAVANFSNSSANAVSYKWDFGDGNSSSLANPSHEYLAAGNFSVKLKAYSSLGDSSETSQTISVKAIADSIYIDKIIINTAPTTYGGMYDWDSPTDPPDYFIGVGNWIDTSKLRTYIIANDKNFPLTYTLAQAMKIKLPPGSRAYSCDVYVYDFDSPYWYTQQVSVTSFYPVSYTSDPDAYPDTITITSGSGSNSTSITMHVRWR